MTRLPADVDDVTVVIATRGRSPFFGEAIASAHAERPADVIVVEDGTNAIDEAACAGARLLRVSGAGRSVARNTGVEAAQTAFVAFLDDDDVALPGRLRRQRAALVANARSPLSFGRVRVVDGAGRPLEHWNELLERRFRRLPPRGAGFAELLAARCPIYTSATMVRRASFVAAGGYDRSLDAHEDFDLYLRLARLGPLVPCPGEPVALYRLHGANTASDRLYEGTLAVVAKHVSEARGRERRLLLALRVDALWGLGQVAEARREAFRAARAEPLLLGDVRFAKRLAQSVLRLRALKRRR